MQADGRTMLEHHLDRLGGIGTPLIVATTSNSVDDNVAATARALGAAVFRGSEHDVLQRYAGAASDANLDVVVRVTSDCPLIDPEPLSIGIERFLSLDDPYAHVSNVLDRTYPRGFDFEVFSAEALYDADRHATAPSDREHVTPYLYGNRSGRTTVHSIRRHPDASRYRLTLDTAADLELLTRLIEDHNAAELSGDRIVDILDANPDLAELNASVEQKTPEL